MSAQQKAELFVQRIEEFVDANVDFALMELREFSDNAKRLAGIELTDKRKALVDFFVSHINAS